MKFPNQCNYIKTCGGKPVIDGRGPLSDSMQSTVGLGLTSLVNSDLTWKTGSKGNRRASRRARKRVTRSFIGSGELIDKDPKRVEDMPVSESEKLGVTILGRRFSDKVEPVPIKKRRLLFRSPSPPPRIPSPCPEETEWLINSQLASSQKESYPNSIAKQQLKAIDAAVVTKSGQVDAEKNLEEINEKLDDNEDFSGISILAAAACSNSMGGVGNRVKKGSVVEESSAQEGYPEVLANNESCSVAKGLSKEHLLDCAEISNEGTYSCISAIPVEETTASLVTAKSSPKDLAYGNNIEGPFFPDKSVVVPQSLSSSKDDGTARRIESSLRDDRSYWDLNIVMDSWERPCDALVVDSETNVAEDISEDVIHSEKLGNLLGCATQREPVDTQHDNEKTLQPMVGIVVSGDVHGPGDIYGVADSRNLALGTRESSREDHKIESHTSPEGITGFQEKVLSSDIDNAPKSVMDLAEETKPLHIQERISSSVESVVSASVQHALEPSSKAVADENSSTQCISFVYTGNRESLSSHQVVSMDACSECSPCPGSNHITSTLVYEERNAASIDAIGMQSKDDCGFDAQVAKTTCLSVQAEKHDVTLPHAEILSKATCEINSVNEDADRSSNLFDDGNAYKKTMSTDDFQPLGSGPLDDVMENAASKSDEMDVSQSSPNFQELSTPGGSVGKGRPVVSVDTKVQDGKVSVADTSEHDSPVHMDSEELAHNSSGQSKAILGAPVGFNSHEASKSYGDDPVNNSAQVALEEDPSDDSSFSDVSQDDPGQVIGIEKVSELQASYDSQYEDGELRESFVHSWEENAGEDGEAEHVDYGSDNRDAYGFDADDYPVSMSVQVEEGAEYKKERSAGANHFGCENDQVIGKNIQETNSQPCLGGSSTTNVTEVGPCKKRAEKVVKTHMKAQFARKEDTEKFGMDVKVDRDLSADADKVMGDYELRARGDAVKESTNSAGLRMKMSGWDQLPEGCKSSADTVMKVRDDSPRKNHTSECIDGLNAEDSKTRVVESRTYRRGLLSRIEGPTSSDMLLRKDRVFIQGSRSNNLDDSNPRAERDTSSGRSIGRGGSSLQMHGRGWGVNRRFNSSECHWGDKRHHSPSYHGPAGLRPPGPKDAAAKVENSGFAVASDGSIVKAGGMGPHGSVHRQSINAPSQGVHRSLPRRRSPVNRDDAIGNMGIGQMGEMSPDRCITVGRGRSGRFGPRVFGRGPRERYLGPQRDGCIESSLRVPHPSARRERSFSPIQRRGAPLLSRSHTRSPSRSRTGSPNVWPSPRGRSGAGIGSGPGLRHRSRSPPNFRVEARTERMRSPHQRPGFAVDHIAGFMSAPRSRSSQYTTRWIDDRKDAQDHFREHGCKQQLDRRSPERNFPRSHRFDMVDSPGRLKPDQFYRPSHPGRFPEMAGAGKGPRYGGSDDDRRKHVERYGMVHSVRRYDMDGVVKQFRYDAEEGFAPHNSHRKDSTEFHVRGSPKDYDKGIDSRLGDAPRRAREEKDHFRYGRDGKYNANSKSFSLRECDEDVAPRRRRHS